MKYTLLQLVQTVASSCDADEINSISDTTEADQITTIVKTAYMDIISRANLPEHFSLVNLDPSGDADKPTLMYVPSTVDEVIWIKYDGRTTDNPVLTMQNVTFMELKDFLEMLYQYDLTDTDTYGSFSHTVGGETFTVPYRKDHAPCWYSTFDDSTLVFDSYDNTVDSTLQSSKTVAYARLNIPWSSTDDFVPDLNDAQFALLLNEAKALAWAELKQSQHTKAEVNAKRGWTRLQRTQHQTEKLSNFDRLPNYGRR